MTKEEQLMEMLKKKLTRESDLERIQRQHEQLERLLAAEPDRRGFFDSLAALKPEDVDKAVAQAKGLTEDRKSTQE